MFGAPAHGEDFRRINGLEIHGVYRIERDYLEEVVGVGVCRIELG